MLDPVRIIGIVFMLIVIFKWLKKWDLRSVENGLDTLTDEALGRLWDDIMKDQRDHNHGI